MPPQRRAARAVLTHTLIAEIERLPQAAVIFGAAGDERVARIRQMLPIAWVELEDHLALVDVLHATIGAEIYRQLWRRVIVQTLGAPLVAGVVRMSTASGGPLRLLARAQMVHGALTIGTGSLALEDPADRSCVLTLRGFPSALHSLTTYADGIAGSILGACDRANVKPLVTTHIVSETRGDVRYDVSWR